MTDHLEELIQLQDIDVLLREVRDPEIALHEERLGFALDNVATLERARQRLAARIDERLLQTYERMSRRLVRVVVPVERSICGGCRMSLPTAAGRGPTSQSGSLENCENCGRILYRR
jgi:predicted  nucleic acid-binding Zn-ribbon protein